MKYAINNMNGVSMETVATEFEFDNMTIEAIGNIFGNGHVYITELSGDGLEFVDNETMEIIEEMAKEYLVDKLFTPEVDYEII